VSFTVRHGEVVGVIGRNGAGKSTLLKILSRITEPTRGEVKIRGRVGSLLEVGTGFHPELTGREIIFLYGAILGMRREEITRKFDEIVSFAEIEKFLDTPVKHFSSGMYTRLAFSVAAHLEPEILVIDEVLAVGDAGFQKKCLGKMSEVAREGRTVLFVSHNMNAVEELCRSAILLDQGRIRKIGPDVREIVNSYIFGGEDVPHVSEWINPGEQLANPWFQPLRFVLTDEHGRLLSTPVRNDEQMWVQIEGVVEQLDPAMNVGYAISAEDGRLLYWSLSTDGPESTWPAYRPGKCVLRSRIPSRFLNEGDYRLEMIVSLHHRAWLAQPGVSAPSILLTIRGGLSDSPYWMTRRPGLVGPVFPWLLFDESNPFVA
jgi:lipopolysaccharide transport system ATP-binding protein